MESELEKLRIQKTNQIETDTHMGSRESNSCAIDFTKLMPKFYVKVDDIIWCINT